jgi:hypothetical protein
MTVRSLWQCTLAELRWRRLPETVLSSLVGRLVQVACALVERP